MISTSFPSVFLLHSDVFSWKSSFRRISSTDLEKSVWPNVFSISVVDWWSPLLISLKISSLWKNINYFSSQWIHIFAMFVWLCDVSVPSPSWREKQIIYGEWTSKVSGREHIYTTGRLHLMELDGNSDCWSTNSSFLTIPVFLVRTSDPLGHLFVSIRSVRVPGFEMKPWKKFGIWDIFSECLPRIYNFNEIPTCTVGCRKRVNPRIARS